MTRWAFRAAALLLGAIQTWHVRHRIFSDGISYLEIAAAYLRADYHNALNAYWSPLYSWLLALTFLILRPSEYWQVAALHLLNFALYLAGLAALELLMRELSLPTDLHIAGYTVYIFAGLYLVGIGYTSPDMAALALLLLLAALILRARRTGGSIALFAAIGLTLALSFFARTAFALSIPLWLVALLPRLRAAAIVAACTAFLVIPFVIALSVKEGRLTIGESGRLNYAWEIGGAPRLVHWQGEPGDLGTPTHPTHRFSTAPAAYSFDGPVAGSYSPWYDPSYWYDGIRPHLKLAAQWKVFWINLSVVAMLLVLSPVFLPALWAGARMGFRKWLRNLALFWPVLVPVFAGMILYCLVFADKRYIAGHLVLVWMAMLASVRIGAPRLQNAFQALCLLFLAAFAAVRLAAPARLALDDLIHRREAERNLNYLLTERLRELGLHAGDRIAIIGTSINADWARIGSFRIIAEVPATYPRDWKPFRNFTFDDPANVGKFWDSDAATRAAILRFFREAGAKMAIVEGSYYADRAAGWEHVLPEGQSGLPFSGGQFTGQASARYLWLR